MVSVPSVGSNAVRKFATVVLSVTTSPVPRSPKFGG
jgi:hypothetical protein